MLNPNKKPSRPRTKWVSFTRRTNYPKLGYIIYRLKNAGVKYRCERESSHAPILEVPEVDLDLANSILGESVTLSGKPSTPRFTKTTLDDLADDHKIFAEWNYER